MAAAAAATAALLLLLEGEQRFISQFNLLFFRIFHIFS
jgi:hypothetical protein